MKDSLVRLWRWVRWPLLILAAGFVALVALRYQVLVEQDKTDAAVAKIHATKLTHEDVFGSLPPAPDKAANDMTVAGIDSNNNGIRDDVEIAIYKNHKDSAKVTAAMLQYAKTEQLFLTNVYNTDTWKAVAEEDSRASFCISETYPRTDLKKFGDVIDQRIKEVEDLVFNTDIRKAAKNKAFDFTTSYGLINTGACDISLDTLSN